MKVFQLSLLSDGGFSTGFARVGGLIPSVKASMQRALAAVTPPMSRDQLVDRMNSIAKQTGARLTSERSRLLSLATLEKWLCPSERDHVPSLEALEVFMLALDTSEPLARWAELRGCKLITAEEAQFYRYGKAKFEAKEHSRQLKRLEEDIADTRKGGK